MPTDPLGKDLAPEDDFYDIVEGEDDPLASEEVMEVEDELPIETLEDFPDEVEPTSADLDMIEAEDDVEVFDDISQLESMVDDDDIGTQDEWNEELYEDELDYEQPGELVQAVLKAARTFSAYDPKIRNSIRRALALCDKIETMIVAGVENDCSTQQLSIPQLKLLDDIEVGLKETRAALKRPTDKTVTAKNRFTENSIYYDPFCATVARVLINAMVQGGKKVQDVFGSLQGQYSIDKREELQISQIMQDMGYPVRSLIDGQDMIEQYYA